MEPTTTVQRLPMYHRCLQKLNTEGVEIVSSKELGEKVGVPATQVRKDLSYYGEFGQRGVGYQVSLLLKHLRKILGLEKEWKIVLVGVGHLGQALIKYQGFRNLGLNIDYAVDIDPQKVSTQVAGVEIKAMSELEQIITKEEIEIGIIAAPAQVAQEIADKLVAGGIKAIWNFAPRYIEVPYEVKLVNEDLSVGLIGLTYHLAES